MKAVIDTCVFASHLLRPGGAESWLLALWRERRFAVVISDALRVELVEFLECPEVRARIAPELRLALVRRLRQDAVWTPGSLEITGAMRDPEDDKLVSAALEAGAEFIITWDARLLEQETYSGVQFVTPGQFVSIVGQQSD